MLKKSCSLILILLATSSFSNEADDYLARFQAYLTWSQTLPKVPNEAFFNFIAKDAPLSNKLREKWLYQLALHKDWTQFSQYYQPTHDLSLTCYAQIAHFYQGYQQQAINMAKSLWLSPSSQPRPCNELFDLLEKKGLINDALINERIRVALAARNISLVHYLLKHFTIPKIQEEKWLTLINQNPTQITKLSQSNLHQEFYLFGLKRLVSINMKTALRLFKSPMTRSLLDESHQQAFLAHVALYKAMRGQDDTPQWFAKVKSAYYNDILLDWQIRFALKKRQWSQVERLSRLPQNKDNTCWQYWLARALEANGKKTEAKALYQTLSTKRQYYGFMASLRLNKSPSFENEPITRDLNRLKPYQSITTQIKSYYLKKQDLQASRLLNDFISELPKNDQSALAYWVSSELGWHGKSVYLSNTETLNNQLDLRFPLAHHPLVNAFANQYKIPKEYVFAIIRQESAFKADVVSGAGAYGLMQIMPRTALLVSRQERISFRDKRELFTALKNIQIGVAYLKQLAKRFHRHPVLMAAAYNAGPQQVNHWLRNENLSDLDIFIETIPWQETRNYLKNVMAFYTVYQYRTNKKMNLNTSLQRL